MNRVVRADSGPHRLVIDLGEATIPLLLEIVRDGRVLAEAAPGLAATWRYHALLDLETDLPWDARMQEAWVKRVKERGIL